MALAVRGIQGDCDGRRRGRQDPALHAICCVPISSNPQPSVRRCPRVTVSPRLPVCRFPSLPFPALSPQPAVDVAVSPRHRVSVSPDPPFLVVAVSPALSPQPPSPPLPPVVCCCRSTLSHPHIASLPAAAGVPPHLWPPAACICRRTAVQSGAIRMPRRQTAAIGFRRPARATPQAASRQREDNRWRS